MVPIQSIVQAIPLAIRLFVVLAMFGLSAAQAGASMHGKTCASEIQMNVELQAHSHPVQAVTHGSDGHTHGAVGSGDDTLVDIGDTGPSGANQFDADQSDCCKSFCSSIAILEASPFKNWFDGQAQLNAHVVQQLEDAAEAAIFTPPNA